MKRGAVGLVVLLAFVASSLGPGARAGLRWADPSTAPIHPSVQTYSDPHGLNRQCTSNFVFTDNTDVYIGQSAHCSSLGTSDARDGCTTPSLPIGTEVRIVGASKPGTLAYSSWLAMQTAHETDPNACAFNDFALVRVDPSDAPNVSPWFPHWGGPRGYDTAGLGHGAPVWAYGNSMLRGGFTLLSPQTGTVDNFHGESAGWHYLVTMTPPPLPGDDGGGYLDGYNFAMGTLSSITMTVKPDGSSVTTGDVTSLDNALQYMWAHGVSQELLPVMIDRYDEWWVRPGPLDTTRPVTNPVGEICNYTVRDC